MATLAEIRKALAPYSFTTDPQEGIVLGRDNDVKRAGYRSAQDQVMELTRAGIRLELSREMAYPEPTAIRSRHYGELDITIQQEKLSEFQAKLREQLQAKADKDKKAKEEQDNLAFQAKVDEEIKKRTQPPKKAEETTPEGGGVT